MTIHYVVIWDFDVEESGEVVKDGVVFSGLKSAQDKEIELLLASLDSDFSPRLLPVLSKRLGKTGYVTGVPSIYEVEALQPRDALQEAMEGKGKIITRPAP